MKKNLFKLVISLIFVVMTVVCLSVFMLTDASAISGSGTAGSPYQIASVADWKTFADGVNNGTSNYRTAYVKLTADLTFNTGDASDWLTTAPTNDMTGYMMGNADDEANGGADFFAFQGNFDGQGHVISGYYVCTSTAVGGTGIFAMVQGATIKNLVVTNSCFQNTSQNKVAAVVGAMATTTTVSNIYVTDSVYVRAAKGNRAGVVSTVFDNCTGTISNCFNAANISVVSAANDSTRNYAGGIVGNGNSANFTINDCLNISAIGGYRQIGGIAGSINHNSASINRCINIGSISGGSGYKSDIGNAGSGSTYVHFYNCFGIGDKAGRRVDSSSTYTKISAGDIKTNASFLTGKDALTSTWTNLELGTYVVGTTQITQHGWVLPTGLVNALSSSNKLGLTPAYSHVEIELHPAPGWITSAYSSGTFTINSTDRWIEFAKFFNGQYDEKCDDLMEGKTVNITVDLTFNTGTASSWLTSFSGTDMTSYMIGDADETNHYVPFKGTLNGNGHVISGLYISTAQENGTGLFAMIEDATIQNLIITNSCIKTTERKIAAVVGQMTGESTISNVYVTNSVYVQARTGNRAGIVSTMFNACDGTIENCVNAANISVTSASAGDKNYVGGILGNGNSGAVEINDCLNLSDISGNEYVAGIAGAIYNNGASINRCINLGTVTGTGSNGYYGDIVNNGGGSNYAYYYDCFGIGAQACGRRSGNGVSYETGTKYVVMEPGFIASSAFSSTWTQRSTAVDNGNNTETVTYEYPLPSGVASFSLKPTLGEASFTRSTVSFTGWGTLASPYLITNVADMLSLANYAKSNNFAGYYFELTADITLNTGSASGWASSDPANKLNPIGTESVPFCGIFDGKGYTFSGIYENQNEGGGGYGVGIFGVIGNGAVIKNFRIVNSYFTDDEWLGAVVGEMNGGTIDSIYVGSDVYVKSTGSGKAIVGGIVGGGIGTASDSRAISNCIFAGTVNSAGGGNQGTGGIVGSGNGKSFTLTNCMVLGSVSGTSFVGGIFGRTGYDATVTNCVYAGSAYGDYPIGNFTTATLTISGCYSTVDTDDQYYQSGEAGSAGVTEMPAATSFYSSGSGTSVDPYIINNWAQLVILSYETYLKDDGFAGKYFKLGNNNITINEGTAAANWTPDAALRPIGSISAPFSGNFDGNKKTISGLYVVTADDKGTGLFGALENATVSNIIITNSCIKNTASYKTAALVGQLLGDCTISNIYVTDSVYVTGYRHNLAGIVGGLESVESGHTISNCVNAAHLSHTTGTSNDRQYIAGIVGNGNGKKVTINDCLNLADISGTRDVAGIMGRNSSADVVINRCVNLGNISGSSNVAQIAVSSSASAKPTLNNCYALTSTFGVNTNDNSCETITVDQFITKGFLTGTALASNWTERAGTEISFCGTTIASDARETCIPNGLASFTLPNSSFYGKAPQWLLDAYDADEFTITTKAEFGELAKFARNEYSFAAGGLAGKTVTLGADLTFNGSGTSASTWGTSAPSYNMLNYIIGLSSIPFKGTFDGDGHTISGYYINSAENENGTGIFGTIHNGTVQNLIITNSYFYTSLNTVGAVAGQIRGDCNISNIYVTDSVYVTSYGINSNGNTGGIVGLCDGSGTTQTTGHSITSCFNAATVKSSGNTADNRRNIGGIVGNQNNKILTVSSCMNVGTISGGGYVAGIVGRGDGDQAQLTIEDCVNTGNIFTFTMNAEDNEGTCLDVYADIWSGLCSNGNSNRRRVSISNCYGIGSKLLMNNVATKSSNYNDTDCATVKYMSLYGESALSNIDISGFTARENDIIVPTDIDSYIGTVFKIRMENGASVRLNTPTGIRFIAELNPAAFTSIDSYGILYGPTASVSASGFNPENLTLNTDYVKVQSQILMNQKTYDDDGYYVFSLAVVVAEKNYEREFSARAYVVADGETYYSDYLPINNSRSVATVSRLALEDVKDSTDDDYKAANEIVAGSGIYSYYSSDKRATLSNYVSKEVRVMQVKDNGTSSYVDPFEKAVKEIYKYSPDVILLSGAGGDDLSALDSVYTTYEYDGTNTNIRVLYKTDRFTCLDSGAVENVARYVKLRDNVTGKTMIYVSVDYGTPETDMNTVKGDSGANAASTGMILGGGFKGDESTVTADYLTGAHATATTQYYTNYYTYHNTSFGGQSISTGVLYKDAYATVKRFRISDDPFGAFSNYHSIICDFTFVD